MIDTIVKQVNPKQIPIIFIAIILLGLLASYLYIFKKPLSSMHLSKMTLQTLANEQNNISPLESNIVQIESQITLLEQELYGADKDLPNRQLVSYVIKQLDELADKHNIKLGGVKPGENKSVLMFIEIPFHVDINGNYYDLYNWLQDVEVKLGPMMVKEFDIQANATDKQKRDMRLTIVSYRQNSDSL